MQSSSWQLQRQLSQRFGCVAANVASSRKPQAETRRREMKSTPPPPFFFFLQTCSPNWCWLKWHDSRQFIRNRVALSGACSSRSPTPVNKLWCSPSSPLSKWSYSQEAISLRVEAKGKQLALSKVYLWAALTLTNEHIVCLVHANVRDIGHKTPVSKLNLFFIHRLLLLHCAA